MMSFRKVILAEVERRGLSAYRVAMMADLPKRTVQRYFAGHSDLLGERVARIAAALGLGLRPLPRRKGGAK